MFTPYIEEIVYDIINKMIRERKLHFTDTDVEEIVNKYGEFYGDEYVKYILHGGGFNKVVEKINKVLNQHGMTLYKFEVDGIWQYCVESSKIPVEIQGILCSYASDYIGNKIAADIIMMGSFLGEGIPPAEAAISQSKARSLNADNPHPFPILFTSVAIIPSE